MNAARQTIYDQEAPLAVRRSAWVLYQHELGRINPATCRPYTQRRALTNVLKWIAGQRVQKHHKRLTPTEQRVVRLLVEGMTQKQTAMELGCKRETVKTHLTNIRRKLGMCSTYQVIAVAVEHGWVRAPKLD